MPRRCAWFFVCSCLVARCLTSEAAAADYTLVFESVETIDAEQTVQTLEVFARPEVPYAAKMAFGKRSFEVQGTLGPAVDGKFVLQVEATLAVDNGVTQLADGGVRKPVLETTLSDTTLQLRVGERLTISSLKTVERSPGKEPRKAHRETTVLLKPREAKSK